MKHPVLIAPSLLSADFANLRDDVLRCQNAGAEVLHLDVMDGHFVPNITFGPMVVAALRPHSTMIFDCHLMIENPDAYIPAFANAGADWISVHVEECKHLHRTLGLIRSHGCKAGIVLNPSTPLEYAFAAAADCDFILLMSVNPGFGGQSFIPSLLQRARLLRDWLDAHGCTHVQIEVDGGVKADNTAEVVAAGVNIIVSGSGIFSGNLEANIAAIRSAAEQHQSTWA
ncbi:MAG: ribulose-phosphate 3-epimerase [Candidatus Kapabacteria bacterium]|nr:ribulose-phosphate 3-epimerase [Candidatus Kapabacteria bacterium]